MAAKEVIYFLFRTQLGARLRFPAPALCKSSPCPLFAQQFPVGRLHVGATNPLSPWRSWRLQAVKLHLFGQILELNRSFARVILGRARVGSVRFSMRGLTRHARSGVEIARVYANREFLADFDVIVENDAKWAWQFQRDFDELRDRDDIYLEIRDSELRGKGRGLPPGVVILPDSDLSEEDRYDEKCTRERKKSAPKWLWMTRTSSKESRDPTQDSTRVTPRKGGLRP
jgi:hypothetical protein